MSARFGPLPEEYPIPLLPNVFTFLIHRTSADGRHSMTRRKEVQVLDEAQYRALYEKHFGKKR